MLQNLFFLSSSQGVMGCFSTAYFCCTNPNRKTPPGVNYEKSMETGVLTDMLINGEESPINIA